MVPAIGKKYRHFKGKTFEVISLEIAEKDYRERDIYNHSRERAIFAESSIKKGEEVVIYKESNFFWELYWARSLSNFMGTLTIPRFSEVES